MSADVISRTIVGRYINQDKLDRWARIQAGILPDDDPTPPAPTPDEVAEREQDSLDEIQREGQRKNERIRDDTDYTVRRLNREIESLQSTQGRARAAALRRARQLSQQVDETIHDAQRDLERVGDEVREQREEARKLIRREAEKAEERVLERIEELKKGIKREVEKEVRKSYFYSDDFTLDSFELM